MSDVSHLEKKGNDYLTREYHDLLIVRKLIEVAMKSRQKNLNDKELQYINDIFSRINKDGRIERRCEHVFQKLEHNLEHLQTKHPSLHLKIVHGLEEVELIKQEQLRILYDTKKLSDNKTLTSFKNHIDNVIAIIPKEMNLLGDVKNNVLDYVLTEEEFEDDDHHYPNNIDVFHFDDFSDLQTQKFVLQTLRSFYAPKLIREIQAGKIDDVAFINSHGFGVQFSGPTPNVNYAMFYNMRSKIIQLPPVIKIRSESFAGSHAGGIAGKQDICVYAGIITNNGETTSSEWPTKIALPGTPKHTFGMIMKDAFLRRKGYLPARKQRVA